MWTAQKISLPVRQVETEIYLPESHFFKYSLAGASELVLMWDPALGHRPSWGWISCDLLLTASHSGYNLHFKTSLMCLLKYGIGIFVILPNRPALATASAFSLPLIPTWFGIQWNNILLSWYCTSQWRCSSTLRTRGCVQSQPQMAWRADFKLEKMMKILSSSSAVSIRSRARYRACNSAENTEDLFGKRSIEEELSMTAAAWSAVGEKGVHNSEQKIYNYILTAIYYTMLAYASLSI